MGDPRERIPPVSQMSPRLGGTPGDCRGLQGKDLATDCAAGRARSSEVVCHHQLENTRERVRLPPLPPAIRINLIESMVYDEYGKRENSRVPFGELSAIPAD